MENRGKWKRKRKKTDRILKTKRKEKKNVENDGKRLLLKMGFWENLEMERNGDAEMEIPGKLEGKRETMNEGLENETGRKEERGKWKTRKWKTCGKSWTMEKIVENDGKRLLLKMGFGENLEMGRNGDAEMENPGKLKGKRETMAEGLENETGRREARKMEEPEGSRKWKCVENHGRWRKSWKMTESGYC